MKLQNAHAWNLSPAEAIAVQRELRGQLILEDRLGTVRRVAGVDVGFTAGGSVSRAAVALLSYPELTLLEPPSPTAQPAFLMCRGCCRFVNCRWCWRR